MKQHAIAVTIYLLWLIAGAWVGHVEAASVTPSSRVAESLAIREKPTTHSTVIAQLAKGKQLELLGELPNWYEVRINARQEGYVHKGWSRIIDDSQPDTASPGFVAPVSSRQGQLEIHFIDVGQGDSTLILCPNGNRILIDAGSSANGSEDDVRSYLLHLLDRSERILDALVVTHPDIDHYNYLPDILRGVRVKQLFRTGDEEDFNDKFVTWLHTIPANRQHVLFKKDFDPEDKPNSKLACGDAKIHILAAGIPTTRRATNFIKNSLSTVLMVRYGTFNVILTGDATFDTEDAILKRYPATWLKSEVLKMGHHGSRLTSTSDAWAQVVSPKVAVASAGSHSIHGHPSEEVVQRLAPFTDNNDAHTLTYAHGSKPYKWIEQERYDEAIYSTSDSSNIVITSDGTHYDIKHEPF